MRKCVNLDSVDEEPLLSPIRLIVKGLWVYNTNRIRSYMAVMKWFA